MSVFVFDPDVNVVIDLILTSLDTGIPVSGNCLLDQTPAYFDYLKIIRHEQRLCHDEIEKLREQDRKKEASAAKRQSKRR